MRAIVVLLLVSHAFAERPNVLFLSIDDLKPELACYGADHIHSPNIDKLASSGVLFERAYCQQAVCAASRMSTFTGMRPDRTKVWDLQTDLRTVTPEAVTLQEVFKGQGYHSLGVGKVMHGSRDEDPPSWSEPFVRDDELTYAGGFAVPADKKYQSEAVRGAEAELDAAGIKNWSERKKALRGKGVLTATECLDVPDDAYADGAIAVWADQKLQAFAESGQPFFLTLGFHKPHLPFVAPKKYWDLYERDSIVVPESHQNNGAPEYAFSSWGELRNYSGIPKGYTTDISDEQKRELIHGYYACVSYVDAQVGRVLDSLERAGLADDTIVVLWGDHGWHLGDHGLWCKHTNFEQATRIPVILRGPGVAKGERRSYPVEGIDLFPTLCALAGIETPAFAQGQNLQENLRKRNFAISQFPRSHKKNMGYAMRTQQYRLVMWLNQDFRSTTMDYDASLVDAVELYDYSRDDAEGRNLASDPEYRDIRGNLEAKLIQFFGEQRL